MYCITDVQKTKTEANSNILPEYPGAWDAPQ